MVIDANGLGIGLMDLMVIATLDEKTGEVLPSFGVYNTDDYPEYKQFVTKETELDAIYAIKANAALNTEAHVALQSYISSGKLKFLIDERVAKGKLLNTAVGKSMKPEERALYLKPYTLTSNLKEELMNLHEETEGVNIILKQANRRIPKDKVSALEYGIYYIKKEEEKKKKHKRFKASEWMFMN